MSQLLHGDCLDILPTLPDHSVDMILADNPYAKTSAAWDILIPMEPLWREYKRLIKPRGAIVLMAAQPLTSMLIMSNPKWYRHCWVWDKGYGLGITAKSGPIRYHEDVLVFGFPSVRYSPIMTQWERPYKMRGKSDKHSVFYGSMPDIPRSFRADRYPTSLLRIPKERHDHIHPTQKPVPLFEYLLKTYSLPGQIVLDNAAGSMTTAIAAIRTGRQYICVERDATYFAKGADRVARELAQVQQGQLPQEAA